MTAEDLITRVRRERADAEQRLRNTDSEGRHTWEPAYGFTSRDRVLMAAAVEAIRRKICSYGGEARCDCKYGIGVELAGVRPGSEASGCPELRSVVLELLHPAIRDEQAARLTAERCADGGELCTNPACPCRARLAAGTEWVCEGCGYHNNGGICTHCGRPAAGTEEG